MKILLSLALVLITYTQAYTQVGINTENPTEMLDINGNMRLRSSVNLDSISDPSDYTNILRMNSSGVFGYVKEKKTLGGYTFYDVYSQEMSVPVTSTLTNGSIPLNVSIRVQVPANSSAIFFIDYNIPISADKAANVSIESFPLSYLGITLFKTGNIELEEGSRKFTVSRPANGTTSAIGMPVLGKSVQKVKNSTDEIMHIDYYLNGYIEGNTSNTTIRCGMYSPTGSNFNWGRGLMTIMSYVKDIE